MPDQGRGNDGKFAHVVGSYRVPLFGNEPLDKHIEYKAAASEARSLDILFDEHRKLFGWHTKSDMYRELMYLGRKQVVDAIPKPDPELLEMVQQDEEMIRVLSRLRRHQHVERVINEMDETIKELETRRDYGAIRRALQNIQATTKETRDPVLREAMRQEFDRRWGRLWQELNRGASLTEFAEE